MAKYVCTICGYVHEGDSAPAQCPQCKAPAEKFKLVDESAEKVWADEQLFSAGTRGEYWFWF